MASAAEKLNETIKNIVELNRTNMQRCNDTVSSIETLTSNLTTPGAVVRAVRVIWRDVGLDTKKGPSRGRSATRWRFGRRPTRGRR